MRSTMKDEFSGKTFVSRDPFRLYFLIYYSAPFTGEGSIIAPKGLVLKIKYSQGNGRYACNFKDKNFAKQVDSEARKESEGNPMLEGRYAGFDPMVEKDEILAHFDEVKK